MATYEYEAQLRGDSTAAKVARLVGPSKSVLEIGCGPGSQSRIFSQHLGCSVVGIEIDPERAAKARQFCKEVHTADLEATDLTELLGGIKFDVIVCADVLEHLRDPSRLLARLPALMQPDGYLVASLPNVTHASVVFELVHGRFEYGAEGLLDQTHVRFFTLQSAVRLLEGCGFLISDLQRTQVRPKYTEFQTDAKLESEQKILELILKSNPEAMTYQFIFKAHPRRPEDEARPVSFLHDASSPSRSSHGQSAGSESSGRRSVRGWAKRLFRHRALRGLYPGTD